MEMELREGRRSELREPKVFNKGEATLEPTAKLLRYLYIGNDTNVFICQRNCPIEIDNLDTRLSFLNDMAALRYSLPFGIIKKVLASNTLRRNDEAILAVAYCLRRIKNIPPADIPKLQADIYKGLPELLKTDSDMFLFVYLSNKIINDGEAGANERTSFGRGMKKCLCEWYERRSALELANIFGKNRGMYGWTHRDIIHMCHMKFGTVEQSDKAKIVATLFKRGTETVTELKELDAVSNDSTWPLAIKRTVEICSLKVNESATDAAEMIKLHNFEVGHLPSHLISQPKIWEILIPKLNYRELMKVFQTLHSLNLLKPNDSVSKKVSMSIGNANLIKPCDIHPLEILAVLKAYEKNERYNEFVKNEWYQKKIVKKAKIVPNQNIIKRLIVGLNHAINHCPQTGCEYFVTLDLRDSVKKHTVLRMSQLTCLEAMVLFALSLKKREKNTKIYSFTDDKSTLLPVKITTDMTFEKALTHCQNNTMKKTKPSLSLPFKYAEKTSKNTIFLTIVDSVARISGQGEAPIDEFRMYRKNSTHSKFIVLNLRRNHGDLQFTYEKGLLEICGLQPDTWKVINAFATNSFA